MSTASGSSLWLTPEPGSEPYRVLAFVIQEIANLLGTPPFVPHVTLCGGLGDPTSEHMLLLKAFTKEARPIDIVLGKIDSNNQYFQALFSTVQKDRNITTLNEDACRYFKVPPAHFFPHLSLAYGDLTPNQHTLVQSVFKNELRTVSDLRFRATNITLWRTNGRVPEWKTWCSYPFLK